MKACNLARCGPNAGATLGLPAVIALAMAAFSGCHAPHHTRSSPDPRIQTEIGNLQQSVERLHNRMEVVQHEQERLLRELEQLRRDSDKQSKDLRDMRSNTQNRFDEIDRERAADRKFIIEEMTGRIGQHLARTSSAGRSSGGAGPERGRYHEVRAGETLSEIAVAYGVHLNVVLQANDIENPDRLRVGQRLFIPD